VSTALYNGRHPAVPQAKAIAPPALLTPGHLAKLMGVAPRTVAKLCDSGKIPSSRIPGSQHRRVRLADAHRFLKENGYDVPVWMAELVEPPPARSLAFALRDTDPLPAGFERVAGSLELGAALSDRSSPVGRLLVGDAEGFASAVAACGYCRELHPAADVTWVLSEDAPAVCGNHGATRTARRPVDWAALSSVFSASPEAAA
jgi:excisionase family DNA binding protein